jgi:hypothetical protein
MSDKCPVFNCNNTKKPVDGRYEGIASSHFAYCEKHLAYWFYLINVERKQISIEQFVMGYGSDGNDILKEML